MAIYYTVLLFLKKKTKDTISAIPLICVLTFFNYNFSGGQKNLSWGGMMLIFSTLTVVVRNIN